MLIELTELWKAFKKYKVPKPELTISQLEIILKLTMGNYCK
jgi:hypothetical protein